jgi:chemotaxis protein MotB
VRGHEEPEKENNERWLLTYSDLITLLLALFIIMFSMSNVDKEKYLTMIESLGSVFGGAHGTAVPGPGTGGDINFPLFSPSVSFPSTILPSANASPSPSPSPTPVVSSSPGEGGIGNAIELEAQAMEDVQHKVEGLLANEHLQNDVTVTVRQRGLVITINSSVLFNSGSAQPTLAARALVMKIASILTPLANNQMCVEGHTDTDPIHTAQFPSNWELSTARATNVLHLLLTNTNLKPSKLSPIGYGEYRPIAPNDTAAHKAMNRRVNIVILKDEYNKSIDINEPAN